MIELMIVVGVIGVFASLAFPNLRGRVDRARKYSEARRVPQFLTEARNLARSRHKCVQVWVIPNLVSARTFNLTDSGACNFASIDLTTPTRSISLPTVGVSTNCGVPFVFDQRGSLTGGAECTVNVNITTTTGMKRYRNVIWPLLGAVRTYQ